MRMLTVLFAVSLAAGLGIVLALLGMPDRTASTQAVVSQTDDAAVLARRVDILERRLEAEIDRRMQMEDALSRIVEGADDSVPMLPAFLFRDDGRFAEGQAEPQMDAASVRTRARAAIGMRQQRGADARVARLEAAGFAPHEADWIIEQENHMRLEALQQQWEQRRETVAEGEPHAAAVNPLRRELGDDGYERYLAATGAPTRVTVGRLIERSPGAIAGLQPGDEIVRYDGRRVFSMGELNAATLQGEPGERVVVDVVRDGTPMQLTVNRGPIGITGRAAWRR